MGMSDRGGPAEAGEDGASAVGAGAFVGDAAGEWLRVAARVWLVLKRKAIRREEMRACLVVMVLCVLGFLAVIYVWRLLEKKRMCLISVSFFFFFLFGFWIGVLEFGPLVLGALEKRGYFYNVECE